VSERLDDLLRPVFDALMAGLKLLGTPVHVWSEGDRGRSATAQAPKDRAPAPDPGARKTKTGWFWALARDERPWDGMAPPDVAFTCAPGPRRQARRDDPRRIQRGAAG
jgi:transposase